jgi:Iron hydrogenase small subunit./TAT (twin-arginine translocation) pathway signal sequence.
MTLFHEKEGINRRQFLKGTVALAVVAAFSGLFMKLGFSSAKTSTDYIAQRSAGLYSLDEKMTIRKSHLNPEVQQLYKEFLSPGEVKPLSSKSHHLLHTRYGKDIPALIEELNHPKEDVKAVS